VTATASSTPRADTALAVAAIQSAISDGPLTDLPVLAGELERLRGAIWMRMMTPTIPSTTAPTPDDDHYLTMAEVKKRTGLSLSYLYEIARALFR